MKEKRRQLRELNEALKAKETQKGDKKADVEKDEEEQNEDVEDKGEEAEDSDEPVFAVPDETDPTVIDKNDDYDEEQDKLQVSPLDKSRYVAQQSNILLMTTSNKGDTPSLQQVNRSILNNDKPPIRDRRFNRFTATQPSEEHQKKAYNTFVTGNTEPLKALSISELKRINTRLVMVQEIDKNKFIKHIIEIIFPKEFQILFSAKIEQLPLRGVFNLCFDSDR